MGPYEATELIIELRGVVFNFLKDAGSLEADLWLEINVLNRSGSDCGTVFWLCKKCHICL